MFLTFSCIFSASKQIYHQLQQNQNSSKPKFSIPNKKKKNHQIRDQFGSENNKTRTTHATRGGLTQNKQIGDSVGRSWV